MKPEFYLNITTKLSKKPKLSNAIVRITKAITYFIYAFYPAFLAVLFFTKSPLLLKSILVPFVSFVVLSVARHYINAPRPYEKIEGLVPLYNKKTVGKSFPSRHTFSGFVIGTVALFFNLHIGAEVLVLSLVLAVCRILCGVHYLRDTIVGALFGIASGLIGMLLF